MSDVPEHPDKESHKAGNQQEGANSSAHEQESWEQYVVIHFGGCRNPRQEVLAAQKKSSAAFVGKRRTSEELFDKRRTRLKPGAEPDRA